MKNLYVLVTRDKYELPIYVALSSKELERAFGLSYNLVQRSMNMAKHRGYVCQYKRVPIPDEEWLQLKKEEQEWENSKIC